jgi:hypothetical protein
LQSLLETKTEIGRGLFTFLLIYTKYTLDSGHPLL